MSDWTNFEEIMQDLSVAQGHTVPAALEAYSATQPPAHSIEEVDREQQAYYECGGGGGGDIVGPDFAMIKKMLEMVKGSQDDIENTSLSSDLDPLSPEFVPLHIQKKIEKNVALSSIITSKKAELSAKRPVPKDVIPIMFKKKAVNSSEARSENVSPSNKSPPEKCQQYVPSTRANEYYKKYVQNSMMKEQFKEDIWTGLERKMKEIDDRKKLRAELASPCDRGIISSPDSACAFDVHLTEHRHLMPGDCIVCIVTAKHGYNF